MFLAHKTLYFEDLVLPSDFEEYIHGPNSHWLSEYEVQEFEASIKEWPCKRMPDHKGKCVSRLVKELFRLS
jgi:hypothetical protein